MAKIPEFKRIATEQFPQEDQETIGKLALVLNPILEQITAALNKQLSFDDNFKAQVNDIEITVNSSNIPKNKTVYKNTMGSSCRGVFVVKVEDLSSVTSHVNGCPFVEFSENGGLISVDYATGLVVDHKYKLRLISIA